MVQLQRPSHVYMGGDLREWDEATVHISSESLIRAASVFEGIKGYWERDNRIFNLLALSEHFERLQRSAQLLHLPFTMSFEDFSSACSQLTRQLLRDDRDLWLRPTLLAVEGNWGRDTVTDLVITAYTLEPRRPDPVDVGLSSWQRAGDRAQPARIKSSANYQVGRLARIEGRRRGYDEMILINPAGRISEATGSCVLVVRDGIVATPPPYEGCLESITVNILERLCIELEIQFVRRPIEVTELYLADEAFLAGTLAEVVPIRTFEDHVFEGTPVIDVLANRFWETVRAVRSNPNVLLSTVQLGEPSNGSRAGSLPDDDESL